MSKHQEPKEQSTLTSKREVFIVRCWPGAPDDESWRVVAEHVRTGLSVPLHSLSEFMAFFEEHLSQTDTGKGLH